MYKYSLPKHWQLEHASHQFPAEFAVSAEEKKRLETLWSKIQKCRPTKPAAAR